MVYYKSHHSCSNPSVTRKSGKKVGRFQVAYIREDIDGKKRWKKIGWICVDCFGFIPLSTTESNILQRGKKSVGTNVGEVV